MAAAAELILLLAAIAVASAGAGAWKECTNTPTQSHTIREQLASPAADEQWRAKMMSYFHLNPTEEDSWLDLHPRRLAGASPATKGDEFDWLLLYRGMTNSGEVKEGESFLSDVPLSDVRLTPGSAYWRAQQTNLEYLLMLDVDRLVYSFRRTAGLPSPGEPYGGWERPDQELRGHFVGHYMSATAMMYASTGNASVLEKMTAVVDALYACQQKIGSGYLSAFPPEFFDRFEAVQPVWAPYYTIHKIMAGLLDQYTFAGSTKALSMAASMAAYFSGRVRNVIRKFTIERHWMSLNEETGGMNDVLYRLYRVTRNEDHLALAHLFDKPCFLGYLAVKADSLSGFHANTHIPVVVGAQMRYEVTGDELYKQIGAFFFDAVNSSHAYATGGTSVREFWNDPKRLADDLGTTENEESCTTYNMLKVSRNLFRWTREAAYGDYYERAMINGVLSIQRGTEAGVMIYMLPQGPGTSKARTYHGWGTRFDAFWCCYGTAIESFSKLGDSIFFEDKAAGAPALYVVQFIPSSFNWRAAGVTVALQVSAVSSTDSFLGVSLAVTGSAEMPSTIYVRIPAWTTAEGATAMVNNRSLAMAAAPGSFLAVSRAWAAGDEISLRLPIALRTEAIKDDRREYASLQAVLFGPYLLAGLSSGDWDARSGNATAVSDWITPVPAAAYNAQLMTFVSSNGAVLAVANGSLATAAWPEDGSDGAVHATFRVFSPSGRRAAVPSRRRAAAGSLVMIEPFDLPGMVVDNQLTVSAGGSGAGFWFGMVPGLDGEAETVSLELRSRPGCYIAAGGKSVGIRCRSDTPDGEELLKKEASFTAVAGGRRRYHPVSFVAKGAARNFQLEPLMSLRDEFYTVYFNVGA